MSNHHVYFRDGHVWDNTCHCSGWYCGITSPSCRSSPERPALTYVLLWGDTQWKPPKPLLQRDWCYRLHDTWWAKDDAGLLVQAAGSLHHFVVGLTLHGSSAPPTQLCLHLYTGNAFLEFSLVLSKFHPKSLLIFACPWSPEFLRGGVLSAAKAGSGQSLTHL